VERNSIWVYFELSTAHMDRIAQRSTIRNYAATLAMTQGKDFPDLTSAK